MPKLSELIDDEAPLEVTLDRGALALTYRPRVLTSAWQLAIGRAETVGDDLEAMLYGPIKDAVIDWDLLQDDGTPYPLTSEVMADIPRKLLMSVLVAVVGQARPNLQTVLGNSTDGSSAPSTRRMATSSRNGTR